MNMKFKKLMTALAMVSVLSCQVTFPEEVAAPKEIDLQKLRAAVGSAIDTNGEMAKLLAVKENKDLLNELGERIIHESSPEVFADHSVAQAVSQISFLLENVLDNAEARENRSKLLFGDTVSGPYSPMNEDLVSLAAAMHMAIPEFISIGNSMTLLGQAKMRTALGLAPVGDEVTDDELKGHLNETLKILFCALRKIGYKPRYVEDSYESTSLEKLSNDQWAADMVDPNKKEPTPKNMSDVRKQLTDSCMGKFGDEQNADVGCDVDGFTPDDGKCSDLLSEFYKRNRNDELVRNLD